MRNRCGKDIGFSNQVLGHETAVGSTYVSDLRAVDKGMGRNKLLHAFNDLFSCPFSPGIHVPGRELLPVSGGATRLQRIDNIVLAAYTCRG